MRQPNPTLENNFVKGLITETTELTFPENAATETFDCVFDPRGFVTRRKGFDFESNYNTDLASPTQTNEVYTEFVWTAVAGDGGITFFVQQQGQYLYFFDLSSSIDINDSWFSAFVIDLDTYLPSGSASDPAQFPCQYASGRGNLIVVNPVCDPFYVVYSVSANTLTATVYEIRTRDFVGLDDGLALTTRPTDTVAGLLADNPKHYYNILNQGWTTTDALAQWDAARADMPSNADYVALYRASVTDSFDNNRVTSLSPLSTPAAKGHFILTATNPNRDAAMVADGFSAGLAVVGSAVSRLVGTIISSGVSNAAAGFDGATTQGSSFGTVFSTGSSAYLGKNYSSSPKRIVQAVVYGSSERGFMSTNPSITLSLYAKQTAPTSSTDGTLLGSVTFTDTGDESAGRTISSNDTSTFWNYVWITENLAWDGVGPAVAEIVFYAVTSDTSATIATTLRPKTVCFFAGRLFYAGIEALALNNTIFFTQILQKEAQYGECYQVNDPTNEEVFALLPTDGGTIVIPEMASVRKLFAYQNALLVLASNGVWLVTGGFSGGFGGGFAANDYFVKKLSSVGTNSPLSVVDRRGVPMWWGEDGIYTIQYDPNFNSFHVINITFKTIRSFFLDIPYANKQYVKAAYDPVFDVIYWLYSTSESLDTQNNYTYNAVLAYNGVATAFYPWTIGDTGDVQVRGVVSVQDATRNNLPTIKYTTSYISGANDVIVYAQSNSDIYLDWSTYGDDIDYTSYFITSYKTHSKGQTYVQSPYVWVFLENIENSGAFVQGIFDFASNSTSGKYSNPQQCYGSTVPLDHVLFFRRLKIRGRGRSMQLKLYSETGKPFQVQGWSVYESIAGQP